MTGPRVLLCGISTRAAAASAARAGFRVTALDAYGDLDQHPSVASLSIVRDFHVPYSAGALARAARTLECDAVAYLSSFENHGHAVTALATGRTLWGNPPAVLRRVRNPFIVADEFRRRGFAVPNGANRVGGHLKRTVGNTGGAPRTTGWLLKPRASGGGHGIRRWRPGDVIPRGSYLHQQVDGVPGSIVFVAAAGRAIPLGVSRQLIGEVAFGASGYRYCGSLMDPADPTFGVSSRLFAAAAALADAAADAFGLVGVNGIDFIVQDDVPYPIEINPRWSSSMELVERAGGVCVFAAHAAACDGGVSSLNELRPHYNFRAVGKAIVFARHDVTMGDTRAWVGDADMADVPCPGDRIAAGWPVCTVFAEGHDATACHAALAERAARVYAQLERWRDEAA